MIEALSGRTYMVRHNPNCPMPFEVRLTGAGLAIRLPYGVREIVDDVGFGKTADDAATAALAAELARKGRNL